MIVACAVGFTVDCIEINEEPDLGRHDVHGSVVTEELNEFRSVNPETDEPGEDFWHFLRRDILQRLAGALAMPVLESEDLSSISIDEFKQLDGAGGDFWVVWRQANWIAKNELGPGLSFEQYHSFARTYLAQAIQDAVEVLVQMKRSLEDLSGILLENSHLEGEELAGALRRAGVEVVERYGGEAEKG